MTSDITNGKPDIEKIDATIYVADPALQAVPGGELIDERPEADPLHHTRNADAQKLPGPNRCRVLSRAVASGDLGQPLSMNSHGHP